ncbi:MAG: DNA repair protein RecN [Candidatus Hydrogenedentes bacterium]|nr:DNA repair protein RecN [Candidatus Hydrogenedentota bacterium]
MLETLRIRDFALIDQVELDFRPGFNALTGETGAGKSILVDALNLVLGARGSAEVVRSGAEKAHIEAVFLLDQVSRRLKALLKEYEIELEDGRLLLARVIGADGRSKGYAGGALIPIGVLAAIGDELVDLHGQHEHQSLLRTDRQIDLLDGFGGTEAMAEEVEAQVKHLREMDRELQTLETDDRERARQVEFLRFELSEIEQAALVPGEEEELRTRKKRITNAEAIYRLTQQIYTRLYESEEGAAIDAIDAAARDLDELAEMDEEFKPLSDQLTALRASLDELAGDVRHRGENLEYDAEELENLNARLAMLSDLKRKYGGSIEDILAYHAKAEEQITAYDQRDERLAQLKQDRDTVLREAETKAKQLSEKRAAAGRKLEKQVSAALQDLGMKGARFEAHMDPAPLSSHGIDRVEFLLSANPGEKVKPLRQVASGGEVSRIMLALKTAFADADQIPTLIFDEIDAGVGGAVARKVAEKMRGLAQSHQVICITHIAQIAALAHGHFTVSKHTQKNRTTTQVTAVVDESRVEEIARLLDGSVSKVSLEHARTLLAEG